MSKIALTPNASGDGVFTITAPNSGTDRAIALPDAAGTIPLLAAASNTAITSTPAELNILDGVTSTAAELNILDGVTATAAEINLIDGGTARGTTALADGDGMLINDAGTMRMSTVQTVKTYMTAGVGGGSMVFIASSGAISDGTASVIFDSDDFDASSFDHYIFFLQHVIPKSDNVSMYVQTSTDGGSNFATTSGDYHGSTTQDLIGLKVTSDAVGSAANEYGVSGRFELYAPHVAANTYGSSSVLFIDSDAASRIRYTHDTGATHGQRLAAEDVDTVRFIFDSGNIESGEIVMYGIANAQI